MMRAVSISFLAILLFHSMGCSSVTSRYLVGSPVKDDLGARFNGIWEFEDGLCYVKYLKEGKIRIAGVEWKDNAFKLEEIGMVVSTCGKMNFINVQDTDEGSEEYLFGYYSFSGKDLLLVWLPKKEPFQEAIESGKIKGKVEKGEHSTTIHIEEETESLCNFIQGLAPTELFDLEDPQVYKRTRYEQN